MNDDWDLNPRFNAIRGVIHAALIEGVVIVVGWLLWRWYR